MKRLVLALILCATPIPAAAADPLYALYASGNYAAVIKAGEAAHSAAGFAVAARAGLADAVLRNESCLDCLLRTEADARAAIAADPGMADGHVWLAVALGYESRLTGILKARWRDAPAQAKAALDAALQADAKNPYAVSALGGWNIEVVRGGGATLARMLYDASEEEGLALFDRAAKLAPGNVAVRYQIALSLAGYNADAYHARVQAELEAAMRAQPQTAYEKAIQGRAGELLALLRKNDRFAFDGQVRRFQGYP